jgi:hypothetical protein
VASRQREPILYKCPSGHSGVRTYTNALRELVASNPANPLQQLILLFGYIQIWSSSSTPIDASKIKILLLFLEVTLGTFIWTKSALYQGIIEGPGIASATGHGKEGIGGDVRYLVSYQRSPQAPKRTASFYKRARLVVICKELADPALMEHSSSRTPKPDCSFNFFAACHEAFMLSCITSIMSSLATHLLFVFSFYYSINGEGI